MEILIPRRKAEACKCTEKPEKEIANDVNKKEIKSGRNLLFANAVEAFVTSIKGKRKDVITSFFKTFLKTPQIAENKTTNPQTVRVLSAAPFTEEEKS